MIGRQKEAAWLLEKSRNTSAELLVLYGRRRVGKTYLLENTFPDAIFLTADLSDTHELVRRFAEPVIARLGLPEGISIPGWDDFFGLLQRLVTEKGNPVIVWDEFQYIPQRDPAFFPFSSAGGMASFRKHL